MQTFNGVGCPSTLPLARRKPVEGEEPIACFFKTVGPPTRLRKRFHGTPHLGICCETETRRTVQLSALEGMGVEEQGNRVKELRDKSIKC
jgi:hypothetical protein